MVFFFIVQTLQNSLFLNQIRDQIYNNKNVSGSLNVISFTFIHNKVHINILPLPSQSKFIYNGYEKYLDFICLMIRKIRELENYEIDHNFCKGRWVEMIVQIQNYLLLLYTLYVQAKILYNFNIVIALTACCYCNNK